MKALVNMFFLFVALAINASENTAAPGDAAMQNLVSQEGSIMPGDKDAFYCICALGYAARGETKKAAASASKFITYGTNSVFSPVMKKGFFALPCKSCCGIPIRLKCLRCNGTGSLEVLKGSKGKCVICYGTGTTPFLCKTCNNQDSVEPSKETCALAFNHLRPVLLSGATVKSRSVEFLGAKINLARARMQNAILFEGKFVRNERGGYYIDAEKMVTKSGEEKKDILVYIKTDVGMRTYSTGENIISICFAEGSKDVYYTDGSSRTVGLYVEDPWFFDSEKKRASE